MTQKLRTVWTFGLISICAFLIGCQTETSSEIKPQTTAAPTRTEEPAPENADEALARLLQGNERFVAGSLRATHQSADWRRGLVAAQHPFATILSCSDSRVPPELLFDAGFGDLFVNRVAGNVVDTDNLGSIEYAVDHLHTPLVLVMGHEGCGAVTAALGSASEQTKEAKEIQELVSHILPALKGIDPKLSMKERIALGVEANVRLSVQMLQNNSDLKGKIDGGHLRIVGAVYELETGKVRWLK
jgi:carbonic anhydrase